MLSLEFLGDEVSQGRRRPFPVEEGDVFLDELRDVFAVPDPEVAEQLFLRHRRIVPGRPARGDLEDILGIGYPSLAEVEFQPIRHAGFGDVVLPGRLVFGDPVFVDRLADVQPLLSRCCHSAPPLNA